VRRVEPGARRGDPATEDRETAGRLGDHLGRFSLEPVSAGRVYWEYGSERGAVGSQSPPKDPRPHGQLVFLPHDDDVSASVVCRIYAVRCRDETVARRRDDEVPTERRTESVESLSEQEEVRLSRPQHDEGTGAIRDQRVGIGATFGHSRRVRVDRYVRRLTRPSAGADLIGTEFFLSRNWVGNADSPASLRAWLRSPSEGSACRHVAEIWCRSWCRLSSGIPAAVHLKNAPCLRLRRNPLLTDSPFLTIDEL
jgi:hypothetical protein